MRSRCSLWRWMSVVCAIIFVAGVAHASSVKYLLMIIDAGDTPVPAEVVDVLQKVPAIKLLISTVPVTPVSERYKALVVRGSLLPTISLSDEPIFSLIDESDARDIFARAQEWFREQFPSAVPVPLLRSGARPDRVLSAAAKTGMPCVIFSSLSGGGAVSGVFRWEDGFAIIPGTAPCTTVDDCWDRIEASPRPMIAVTVPLRSLTASFLAELREKLQLDPTVNMVIPDRRFVETLAREVHETLPPGVGADPSLWSHQPVLWQRLSLAHEAVEKYRNSGTADARRLNMAREELYHLYDHALIARVQDGNDQESAERFTAGIGNIFHLVGQPHPADAPLPLRPAETEGDQVSSCIESSKNRLVIHNPSGRSSAARIDALIVRLDSATVSYQVLVSSDVWASSMIVDIYMDMNNQPGAGMTALLPGPAAFLFQEDGWELAIRMDRYQTMVYRISRQQPVLMRTLQTGKPYQVDIPRTLLRGNPLAWGYQALLVSRDVGGRGTVQDFLCADERQRRRTLAQDPIQLHAVRQRAP